MALVGVRVQRGNLRGHIVNVHFRNVLTILIVNDHLLAIGKVPDFGRVPLTISFVCFEVARLNAVSHTDYRFTVTTLTHDEFVHVQNGSLVRIFECQSREISTSFAGANLGKVFKDARSLVFSLLINLGSVSHHSFCVFLSDDLDLSRDICDVGSGDDILGDDGCYQKGDQEKAFLF